MLVGLVSPPRTCVVAAGTLIALPCARACDRPCHGHSNLRVAIDFRLSTTEKKILPSYVFCAADDVSSDLCPINAGVHGLIHQSADDHVVTSNHV